MDARTTYGPRPPVPSSACSSRTGRRLSVLYCEVIETRPICAKEPSEGNPRSRHTPRSVNIPSLFAWREHFVLCGKMTAKHRKGKSNNKHEDNFFKNEVPESDARVGGNNYIVPLALFLIVGIGGAIGAWFCFQQHQTLTYLTDNLMGLQMKMVKLQSSHEDLRKTSGKQYISESLESRLNALEESYALIQKEMGMTLATAEKLKTSDLPAQVLSLHTEMRTRLTEMQKSTASLEQLSQLHTMLEGKSEEFESVRSQVDSLDTQSAEISQKVELLTGSLEEAESKLKGHVATMSTTLDAQAADVLRLKKQLNIYQAQVEASTEEVANVRELLESKQSPLLHISVDEQLNTVRQSLQDQSSAALKLKAQLENLQKHVTQLMGEHPGELMDLTDEETAPTVPEEAAAAVTEEEALAADVEKEAVTPVEESEANEQREALVQEEAPIEQQDTVTEVLNPTEQVEVVKEDQTENDEAIASSESKEVGTTQTDEKVPEEENQEADEQEESEEDEVAKDSQLEEENQKPEEEEEEKDLEREEEDKDNQPKEEVASEEEKELEESLLESEELDVEEEDAEEQEEQQDVAAEGGEPSENDSLAEDE